MIFTVVIESPNGISSATVEYDEGSKVTQEIFENDMRDTFEDVLETLVLEEFK